MNYNQILNSIVILILGPAITFSLLMNGFPYLASLNIILQIYFFKVAVIDKNYVLAPLYKLIKKYYKR